jgi:hypothetical protein
VRLFENLQTVYTEKHRNMQKEIFGEFGRNDYLCALNSEQLHITTIQMKKILFDAGRKDGSLRIEAKDAIAYPHAHWL